MSTSNTSRMTIETIKYLLTYNKTHGRHRYLRNDGRSPEKGRR